ncbi:MAG: hypothetical protein Q8R88_11340 [Desulfoprunum sp.]|nr:hypothetical protein [Desulfoprunum sp.]
MAAPFALWHIGIVSAINACKKEGPEWPIARQHHREIQEEEGKRSEISLSGGGLRPARFFPRAVFTG